MVLVRSRVSDREAIPSTEIWTVGCCAAFVGNIDGADTTQHYTPHGLRAKSKHALSLRRTAAKELPTQKLT